STGHLLQDVLQARGRVLQGRVHGAVILSAGDPHRCRSRQTSIARVLSNSTLATAITFMLAWYICWYCIRLMASSSVLTPLVDFQLSSAWLRTVCAVLIDARFCWLSMPSLATSCVEASASNTEPRPGSVTGCLRNSINASRLSLLPAAVAEDE